jgi:hypothetical protein
MPLALVHIERPLGSLDGSAALARRLADARKHDERVRVLDHVVRPLEEGDRLPRRRNRASVIAA